MSHSMLAFKNLLGATVLAGSTLDALPAMAQTDAQSDSGLTPIPACVPANTASGYTLPDTSGYTIVAMRPQSRAELCVTPDSPSLPAADQVFLEKFSDGLAEAFASYPEVSLPLSKRFKGKFTGKNQHPDIEITSSGVISTSPGYESVTYLFTVATTEKDHPSVVGQIRVSRPATSSSEEAPGVKTAPHSVPAGDRQVPRLAT